MKEETVRAKLDATIATFLTQGRGLLKGSFPEQVLLQQLARHLRVHFVSWRVDLERDRNAALKRGLVEGTEHDAGPDIIVHRRQPGGNLLAIDIKKVEGKYCLRDCHDKLWEYRLPPYLYQHAAYLEFGWIDGAPHWSVDFR